MPFTVSHVAAVLPLAIGRPGRRLVPAALVIGSMVPDLPYFVPPHRGSGWTHAAYGPVTVDPAAGLVLLAVWQLVLRWPLVDLAPRWVGQRLPPPVPLRGRRWGWAALSVVIGAYTHVLLDTFTHPGRWGTTQLPEPTVILGPLPVYKWLQYGGGVLGLAVLVAWSALWLARAEPRPTATRLTSGQRALAWVVVIAVLVGSAAVIAALGSAAGRSVESTLFRVATGSMGLTALAVAGLCLVWQVLARSDRGAGQGPADRAQRRQRQGAGDQPVGRRQGG